MMPEFISIFIRVKQNSRYCSKSECKPYYIVARSALTPCFIPQTLYLTADRFELINRQQYRIYRDQDLYSNGRLKTFIIPPVDIKQILPVSHMSTTFQ